MSIQDRQPLGVRAEAVASERRAATRFASIRTASCSPLAERQTVLSVLVRDVSANGIGLLSARRFERGTILLLQVQDDGEALPPLLVGKVVYETPQADGNWHIGCALTRAVAQADMRALTEESSEAD